ncbi:FAD binding domain-containing protein [Bacillus sp. Bva_UNVM-123]|uniref:FAD binding domain-containing protein n=1 Tax=Bacillus sp. Bva_UNVM-123 TaxID=2829798 RepID=UPI00391F79B2
MISPELEYYKPLHIDEAIELFFSLKQRKKQPMYYAGGTEIITLGRLNMAKPDAIIDIKEIDECRIFDYYENYLLTGSSVPLTFIEDKNLFPLLTKTSSEIADHTSRNKITLGGNLCGRIFYREAVLPFLLTDSYALVGGLHGLQTVQIHSLFNKELQLEEGQLLIQLITEKEYLQHPFVSIKKRQQWKTGYPLLTVAAIKRNEQIRFAFSGLCPFPFRSLQIENELNNANVSYKERIINAIKHIPAPILDDVEGSKEYRLFVFSHTVMDVLLEMEGK